MRPIYVARWAAVAILLGATCSAARAQLPQEIVNQYRPAVEKLRQAYTHASFDGVSAVTFPQQGKSRKQSFVMRAAGKKRRLDVTTLSQQGMGLEVGATEMRMATPYGSLSTYKAPKSEFFDDAQQTPYADTVTQIDNGSLLNYPYSLGSTGTILSMLLKPGVKVTATKDFESEGFELVQINYVETARYAGHMGQWKSSVVLSPSEGWGLRGFTRTSGQGSTAITQRAAVSYSGVNDKGIPLVSTIEAQTSIGGSPTRREAIEVTKIKFGDPDDYYFGSFAF